MQLSGGEDFEVVKDYRNCNWAVHVPNSQQLAAAAATQNDHGKKRTDTGSNTGEDTENKDPRGSISSTKERWARQGSKNPGAPSKPDTQKHYPVGWKTVIKAAKMRWCRYIVLRNSFPEIGYHLKDAGHILAVTTAKHKLEGLVLEPGLIYFLNIKKHSNMLFCRI